MEEFLEKIELGDMLHIFKENHITLDIAKKLTEQEIKELIPSIGKRKMFTEAIIALKEESFIANMTFVKDCEIHHGGFLIDISNDDISSQPVASSPTPSASSSTASSYKQAIVSNHREVAVCGIENVFAPTAMPAFDLKTLLEATPLGSLVINYYERHNSLDNSKRTILVDIICKKIFNFVVKHRLTHSDYNVLTAKIITLFPTETAGTYYVPAISKKNSINNKPQISKGRLVDKIRNLLRLSRMIRSEKTDTNGKTESNIPENFHEYKSWLDTRIEPWTEVIEKWKYTFGSRRSSTASTVDSFFSHWPILRDPRAVMLINIDYDLIFPDAVVVNLQVDWFQFMEKLLMLKKSTIKDKKTLQLLETLELEDNVDDTKVALHLSLLPNLIPPKSRTLLKNRKHWKFSAAEVLDSILMHVLIPGDIERSICDYRNKMFQLNQTVQPYILVEGPSLLEINSVYVVVDEIRYKPETLLKALDLLYKIFHVANACYPIQSEYLWLIIQQCIYNITTPQDKVIPYILDIIESIKEIESKMKCYLCNCQFSNTNIFISHLTYQHGISDNYKCYEPDCHRVFNRRNAFKRHIVLNHLGDDQVHVSSSETHNPGMCDSFSSPMDMGENNISYPIQSEMKTPMRHTEEDMPEAGKSKFDINVFYDILRTAVDKFVSILYSSLTLNRSIIQEIICAVSDLFSSGIITMVKTCILSMNQSEYNEVFSVLENPFKNLNTEYRRFKYFENSHCFIKPESFPIGSISEPIKKKQTISLTLKQKLGYFVPMRTQLKVFLQIPGVYRTMCEYRENILNEKLDAGSFIINIMQGDLWQTYINNSKHKNTFPLIIYFDDFETCNPLGSHAGVYKQGAVYFSIASFPPQYATKLENIFLAMLFHSNDRVTFGNKAVFSILINELKYLEHTGIEITCNGNIERVFFSMIVLSGDNLGLHSLFGLVESFSANFCCRFCKCHKRDMQIACKEDSTLLRTVDEYDEMVSDKAYGIKEKCVFHDLPNFHIFNNLTCDIMHDLTEGVHRYALAKIIDHFISENILSLDSLNQRIKYFDYNSISIEKNIPPSIKAEHIKNGCIILTSAEMMCLILNLRLIIGDLVPEHNDVWKYYLILLEITEIVIASAISVSTIELLKTLVEEHNHLYVSLFKDNLKPKFHFLLHYPRIIRKVGPLCYIQSIRFEAKHKELKTTANVVTSRKNISLTLSLRTQLQFCHRVLSQQVLTDKISLGPVYEISKDEQQFKNCINDTNYNFCISWFEFNGIRYNNKSILLFDIIDNVPQFCQIAHILVFENNIFFMITPLLTEYFNLHLRSYKVQKPEEPFRIISFVDFKNNIPAYSHCLPNGETYVYISKSL